MKSVLEYLSERALSTKPKQTIQNPDIVKFAKDGDLDKVKELLEQGVDPDSRNSDKSTALIVTSLDDKEIIELLLQYGADINAVDKNGESILIYHAYTMEDEEAEYVLSLGVDKNIINHSNEDACASAYFNNNLGVMDLLKTDNSIRLIMEYTSNWKLKFLKETDKDIIMEGDLEDLADSYKGSSRDGADFDTLVDIILGQNEVGDYDTSWVDSWDDIDDDNMKLIEEISKKDGWDEEESIKDFLYDTQTEVIVAISNAQESAMRAEEYSYMYDEFNKVLNQAGIEFNRETDKVQLTLYKKSLWEQLQDGVTELKEIVEIDTVHYPRYGLGYDDKNFNEILSDRLGEL